MLDTRFSTSQRSPASHQAGAAQRDGLVRIPDLASGWLVNDESRTVNPHRLQAACPTVAERSYSKHIFR